MDIKNKKDKYVLIDGKYEEFDPNGKHRPIFFKVTPVNGYVLSLGGRGCFTSLTKDNSCPEAHCFLHMLMDDLFWFEPRRLPDFIRMMDDFIDKGILPEHFKKLSAEQDKNWYTQKLSDNYNNYDFFEKENGKFKLIGVKGKVTGFSEPGLWHVNVIDGAVWNDCIRKVASLEYISQTTGPAVQCALRMFARKNNIKSLGCFCKDVLLAYIRSAQLVNFGTSLAERRAVLATYLTGQLKNLTRKKE